VEPEPRRRKTVKFRCSDEAYARLFRRQDGRNGDATTYGRRFDEVLRRFLEAVDAEHGLVLHQSGQPSGEEAVRHLTIDAEIKARFDELSDTAPASKETLFREAIWRFTGMR
jgi:hypothetical protein